MMDYKNILLSSMILVVLVFGVFLLTNESGSVNANAVQSGVPSTTLAGSHDCIDFIDVDGDGVCDLEETCVKHNSIGGCGKHELPEDGVDGLTLNEKCGGCPKNQVNGGSCPGKYT